MNKTKTNATIREEKGKLLSPKIDVIFQILFGEIGSEEITKDFLSTILEEKINEVNLNENIVFRRELPNGKMGIVDVLAKINESEYCNIEMQMTDKKNIIKRMLYYWAKQYARGINKREDYQVLKRTIVVLIANFELENLEELGLHSRWKLIEVKDRKIVLTDDIEFNIIELPKLNKEPKGSEDEKLKEWLNFLENPESKEVQGYMKRNENMKAAREKLNEISKDEKVRRIAELRQKAILDEKEAEYTGYCNGLEEGRKEGIKQGIEQRNIEIAKSMKEEGINIKYIVKVTGLSEEEINTL